MPIAAVSNGRARDLSLTMVQRTPLDIYLWRRQLQQQRKISARDEMGSFFHLNRTASAGRMYGETKINGKSIISCNKSKNENTCETNAAERTDTTSIYRSLARRHKILI